MTSDAKIGLLLGLVFIFIIAFVINGLPRFRNAIDSNEVTITQDFVQGDPIGANIRSAQGVFEEPLAEGAENYPVPNDDNGPELAHYQTPAWSDNSFVAQAGHADQSYYPQTYYNPGGDYEQTRDYVAQPDDEARQDSAVSGTARNQDGIRDNRPFPFNDSSTGDVPIAQLTNNTQEQQTIHPVGTGFRRGGFGGFTGPQGGMGQGTRRGSQQAGTIQQSENHNQQIQTNPPAQTNHLTQPKTYVVQEGDNNLSKIAKKFYGEVEGNRWINVNKIYEANKDVLESPDKVFVGQTIVIPSPAPPAENPQPASVLRGTMFQTVPSVGGGSTRQNPVGRQDTGRWYEVKEDDNLWKIASEQLGKGARFNEISELNADILTNENKLKPGMKLRLPAK